MDQVNQYPQQASKSRAAAILYQGFGGSNQDWQDQQQQREKRNSKIGRNDFAVDVTSEVVTSYVNRSLGVRSFEISKRESSSLLSSCHCYGIVNSVRMVLLLAFILTGQGGGANTFFTSLLSKILK
jgi:hypothetical protein